MKTPRLTEVFVVKEANVTTLAQMNKIPVTFAQELNNQSDLRQHIDVLLPLFLKKHRVGFENISTSGAFGFQYKTEEDKLELFTDMFDRWRWEYDAQWFPQDDQNRDNKEDGEGQRFLNLLNKSPNIKQKLRKFLAPLEDYESALAFLENIEAESGETKEEASARAYMKFSDGFFWVEVSGSECGREGKRMQHCGAASGKMYSLRDNENKPHVTVDISVHIMRQCRGKQNDMPDKKYWNKIKDFVKKSGIKYATTAFSNFDAACSICSSEEEFAKYLGIEIISEQDIEDGYEREYGRNE
jgi:hypothetical protein